MVGKGFGAMTIVRADGYESTVGGGLQALGEFVGDAAGAEDAPVDGC